MVDGRAERQLGQLPKTAHRGKGVLGPAATKRIGQLKGGKKVNM